MVFVWVGTVAFSFPMRCYGTDVLISASMSFHIVLGGEGQVAVAAIFVTPNVSVVRCDNIVMAVYFGVYLREFGGRGGLEYDSSTCCTFDTRNDVRGPVAPVNARRIVLPLS